jgi:UDP-N-acetylmuramate--alanine ligase
MMIKRMNTSEQTPKRIHLIGVGGIGVSAVASFFARSGAILSGTDLELPPPELLPEGYFLAGHHPELVTEDVDLVVFSDAVPENDPERARAKRLGVRSLNFADTLGVVTAEYDTIAISGTHGKSTTTALTGLLFEAAGMDPNVFVGAVVPSWGKNVRFGANNAPFIVEADEYRAHMMSLHPTTITITNLEWDHPDYYRDIAQLLSLFDRFLSKLDSTSGTAIINADDAHARHAASSMKTRKVTYSVDGTADLVLRTSPHDPMQFSLEWQGSTLGEFTTLLPGHYNKSNIAAALATFLSRSNRTDIIAPVLAQFSGIGRRFEILGEVRGTTIVSDYAHHPTALRSVFHAANERYPGKRILVAFRPHQQERTRKLFDAYVQVIEQIPDLVLLEIYDVPGRESDEPISSRELLRAAFMDTQDGQHRFAADLAEAEQMLRAELGKYDVILVVGAGDADKLARALLR